ncbi:MAG: serine/threonine-protein kinase [Acidobacteriota bacterium]|nr:serine/threonine-protein kinase [Acidobacteriota bacterium]
MSSEVGRDALGAGGGPVRRGGRGVAGVDLKELHAGRQGDLVCGRALKADLWLAKDHAGRLVVVKDFRRKPWPGRWWGWVQVRRERAFLRLLEDLDFVPRLLGTPHPLVLVLEYVPGILPCRRGPGPWSRPTLQQLRENLERLHQRGVTHNDLRGRDNLLFDTEGRRLVLLDWAAAVRLPPATLRHRLLFGLLRQVDRSAFLKWKLELGPRTLSDEDRRFLRAYRRWRRLWPFNRKGLGDTTLEGL